jgi:uncharacterized membrane protein YqiK
MLKIIKAVPLHLSSDHSSGAEEDEPDRPPVLVTSVIVLLSFLFLVFVAIFAYTFLWKTTDAVSNMMDTGMANETRMDYQKKQDETLSSYKKLDNGLYQVPITQAMEIVVKEQGGN